MVDMILRRLLYHRGLDSAYSCYITDYINGILCFIYAGIFVVLTIKDKVQRRSKFKGRDDEDVTNQHRDTLTSLNSVVVILFVSGALMNLLGGYAHHYVDVLEDVYDSVQFPQTTYSLSEMRDLVAKTITSLETLQPWYVVWEMANFSGSLMAACLLLSMSYLFATEINRVAGRKTKQMAGKIEENVSASTDALLQDSTDALPQSCDDKNSASFCKVMFMRIFQIVAIIFVFLAIGNHLLNLYIYKENIQSDNDILETLNTIDSIEDSKVQISTETNLEKHQLAFSNFEHLNIKKLWTCGLTVITLYSSVFVYALFSTYFTIAEVIKRFQTKVDKDRSKNSNSLCGKDTSPEAFEAKTSKDETSSCRSRSKKQQPTKDKEIGDERRFHSAVEVTADCVVHVQSGVGRLKTFCANLCRVSSLTFWSLRCVGAWFILVGGTVQVTLSSKCSAVDAFATLGCPLPDSFNHNSVYHVGLGLGMTFIFLAEIVRYFCMKSDVAAKVKE